MSSAGRAVNLSGFATTPKGREIGLSGFAAQIRLFLVHWQLWHSNGRTSGAV